MSKITSNSATSKNEIKIEMKFWEAVEITQETYNNYQENADNDLNNLNIEKLNTPKIHYKLCNKSNDVKKLSIRKLPNKKGRFKLYNKFHDKDSNFSGMTYIYDNKKTNTVNVAIACRGSSKNLKDWVQNLLIIPISPYTFADWKARQYATNILNKIKNDEKYKDKKINIITLGHSKGGREAQKQMSKLRKQYKNDNSINICCLTFNSAPTLPIYFLPFNWLYSLCLWIKSYFDKGNSKKQKLNLVLGDRISLVKDILNILYRNNCAYPTGKAIIKIINKIANLYIFLLVSSAILICLATNQPIVWIVLIVPLIEFMAIIFKSPSFLLIMSILSVYMSFNHEYFWYILFSYVLLHICIFYYMVSYLHKIDNFKEYNKYNELKLKSINDIFSVKSCVDELCPASTQTVSPSN